MTALRSRCAALCAALVIRSPVARLLSDWGARIGSSFSGIRPPVRGGGVGVPGYTRFGRRAPGSIDQDIRAVALSRPATGGRITGAPKPLAFEVDGWPLPRAATREQESPYSEQGYTDGELLPYRHVGENSCGRLALLYDGVLDAYQPMLLRSERVRTPGNSSPATGDLILCASCSGSLRSAGALERMETAEGWMP